MSPNRDERDANSTGARVFPELEILIDVVELHPDVHVVRTSPVREL
jgi:hypothetical protein